MMKKTYVNPITEISLMSADDEVLSLLSSAESGYSNLNLDFGDDTVWTIRNRT